MKLIVGLGNPGPQYEKTRHNAGFMVIDRLAKAHAPGQAPKGQFQAACTEAVLGGQRCVLLKPATFMNLSGQSVGQAIRFYKLVPATDLLVIVDDFALEIGQIRLKPSGGTGGHNGLTDLHRALGGESYPRLRVGIGAKPEFMDQADYVLSRFRDEEWPAFESSLDRAAKAAEVFASKGLEAAMNQFNAADRPARPHKPRPTELGESKPKETNPKDIKPDSNPRKETA